MGGKRRRIFGCLVCCRVSPAGQNVVLRGQRLEKTGLVIISRFSCRQQKQRVCVVLHAFNRGLPSHHGKFLFLVRGRLNNETMELA